MSVHCLKDGEIRRQIRELTSKNKIAWAAHAEIRLVEREIDKSQVKECLQKGSFDESPAPSIRGSELNYKFRMKALVDSEWLYVGASLYPGRNVVVITAFK